MDNYTVRKTHYSKLTIKDCRLVFNYTASVRALVLNWTDVPAYELLNKKFYGQFLRRLVIRAMKELESDYMRERIADNSGPTSYEVNCGHCDFRGDYGNTIYYAACGHHLCDDCYSAVVNGVDDTH
jgi:hypothetical protein